MRSPFSSTGHSFFSTSLRRLSRPCASHSSSPADHFFKTLPGVSIRSTIFWTNLLFLFFLLFPFVPPFLPYIFFCFLHRLSSPAVSLSRPILQFATIWSDLTLFIQPFGSMGLNLKGWYNVWNTRELKICGSIRISPSKRFLPCSNATATLFPLRKRNPRHPDRLCDPACTVLWLLGRLSAECLQ